MQLNDIYQLSKPIADHWNEDLSPLVMAEECGELIQAISKYYRTLYFVGEADPNRKQAIVDEMGDTLLMIFAMCWLCEIGVEDVEKRIAYKAKLKKEGAV